jgi:hypothetical protein
MHKTIIYILAFMLISLAVKAVDRTPTQAPPPEGDPIDLMAQADDETPPPDMPMPDGMGGHPGFGPGPRKFEQIRKKKLLQFLQLDEDKADEFIGILDDHRKKTFLLVREHMSTSDSLARGIRSKALSEDEIERFVGKLDKLESDRLEQRRTFHSQVRPLLTAEQFGRLVVFQIRFEAQALGKLNEFRRHRGRPGQGRRMPRPDADSFIEEDSI